MTHTLVIKEFFEFSYCLQSEPTSHNHGLDMKRWRTRDGETWKARGAAQAARTRDAPVPRAIFVMSRSALDILQISIATLSMGVKT